MVFDALCLKTKTEIQINTTCLQIVFPLKKIQKKKKELTSTDNSWKKTEGQKKVGKIDNKFQFQLNMPRIGLCKACSLVNIL